jgi:hypothetical protein
MWGLSKERKNEMKTGFSSIIEERLQVSWNRRIRDRSDVFISKSKGFFNWNWGSQRLVIYWEGHTNPLLSKAGDIKRSKIFWNPQISSFTCTYQLWYDLQISIRYLDNDWDWIMKYAIWGNCRYVIISDKFEVFRCVDIKTKTKYHTANEQSTADVIRV